MAINVLPQNIANQIAAGEVVNRPSSVVKELIENALDAKADEIALIVKDAGRTLVEVMDNGTGMNQEDAQKCFLQHATSKISKEEDLRNLTTMGFRGEALASIAAIAQVQLHTKQDNQSLGTEVIIEGGITKSISQVTCKKGTDIMVKNIFFNVPARRNFLKSDAIESSHILDAFLRTAIINPDVAFTYIKDSHQIYKLQKTTPKGRLTDIFGQQLSKNLLEINEKINLVSIYGFVSTIELTRKNKNNQYFFVNNRFMKNNYFTNAVERAYTNLIAPKSYPVFFINLKVDPRNIDVNIHPTKTEVKFIDDKIIYSVLNSCVRRAIGQNTLATSLDFDNKPIDFHNTNKPSYNFEQPKISYNKSFNPFSKQLDNPSLDFNSRVNNVKVQTEISFNDNAPISQNADINSQSGQHSGEIRSNLLFQFLDKYIVYQIDNTILLINKFKAKKKMIFDALKNAKVLNLSKQKLLIPYTQKFSPIEIISLQDKRSLLQNIGFEFDVQKDNNVVFNAFPTNMSSLDAMNLIGDIILEELSGDEKFLLLAQKIAQLDTKQLSNSELESFIKALLKLDNPEFLPMNERVFLRIDRDFLDKVFI